MNNGYLMNMKCPQCSSEGPFRIYIEGWATVHDDHVTDYDEINFKDDARAYCITREFGRTVQDLEES